MESLQTIILIMTALVGLNCFANKIKVSFPILLVISGLLISLIPGIPKVSLNPNVVFLIFLPPLLYEASFNISWHNFKQLRVPISGMAIGLVLLTTLMVAISIHYLAPSFSWPLAFLLGAIVSPPDAAAATAVTKGMRLPKAITTLLEGESLINDASALIAYRYALVAVTTGAFSITNAGIHFVIIAGGGILIGLFVGIIAYLSHKNIDNPLAETTVSIVTPYISYLFAEHVGVSGVLAVVTTGLFIARFASTLFAIETRVKIIHFWEVLSFLLNGFVFILIGLQLPGITQGQNLFSVETLIWFGVIISLVTILARIIWVFPISYFICYFNPLVFNHNKERRFKWRCLTYVSWSSMRGVVSLASALAIPISLGNHHQFPMRNEILFITFVVILITLVLQGLTLPIIVNKLKIEEPIEQLNREENIIRRTISDSSLNFIKKDLAPNLDPVTRQKLVEIYQRKSAYFNQFIEEEIQLRDLVKAESELHKKYLKAELDIIQHQRKLLIEMYQNGQFNEDRVRQIGRELDAWHISMQQRMKIMESHAN